MEKGLSQCPRGIPTEARHAIESAASLRPPSSGFHPLLHTWNSRGEWRRLVASYAYVMHPRSSFIFHAFGEVLCKLKGRLSQQALRQTTFLYVIE